MIIANKSSARVFLATMLKWALVLMALQRMDGGLRDIELYFEALYIPF